MTGNGGVRRLRNWISVLVLAPILFALGCTTSQVLGVRDLPPVGIGSADAIAVLLRQFPGKFSADFLATEQEIVSCMSDSIHKVLPTLQIIPAAAVRRAAFPDLAPEEIPLSPESLTILLQGSDLRERMAQLHVRHLIVVEGHTKQKAEPSLVGTPGAGAVGIAWARRAHLSAVLVDLRENWRREVTVDATGRPWVGIVGGGGYGGGLALPIVIPAFPEARACGDLGEALAQWLAEAPPIRP
jgi:hypothetical protein